MKWDEIQRDARLARWLDGELTEQEVADLRRDARANADLAAEMEQYERLESLLGELRQECPAVDLDRQRTEILHELSRRRRRRILRPMFGLAAAAAVAVVLAGVFFTLHQDHPAAPSATPLADRVSPALPTGSTPGAIVRSDPRIAVSVVPVRENASGMVRVMTVRQDDRDVPARSGGGGTVVVTVGEESSPANAAYLTGALMDFWSGS